MTEERKRLAAAPMMRLQQAQMERLADMVAERVVKRLRDEGFAEEEYMTYAEAAKFLGYKLSTMRKKVACGEVPCVRPGGGVPRFTRQALTKWMKSRSGVQA